MRVQQMSPIESQKIVSNEMSFELGFGNKISMNLLKQEGEGYSRQRSRFTETKMEKYRDEREGIMG